MTSARSPCRVIVPIRVGIDPREKLLVASFKGDPEFEAIEPQVFDDAVNGKGMRVLRYRKDGRVVVVKAKSARPDLPRLINNIAQLTGCCSKSTSR